MRTAFILAALLAASAARADVPSGVAVRKSDAGAIYTDAQDRTLYTYEQDKNGKSACVGTCAKAWPPLAAPDGATASGDWSTIARDDGTHQWAWKGKPLYTYAKDNPGATFGDGLGNLVWHTAFAPVFTPPGIAVRSTVLGRTLADQRGMTLYWRKSGTCTKDCLETWSPVPAPLAAVSKDDWAAAAREDGTRQWAHRGRALFAFTGDIKAGDVNGNKGAWEAAVLAPVAPPPSWVTIQSSDIGEVYADKDGHTLYVGPPDLTTRIKKLLCDDACINKVWKLVPAAADAKAQGDWSIITDETNGRVWAYRGNVVYVHTRDTKPGDIGGDKWAVGGGGGSWTPITRRADDGA